MKTSELTGAALDWAVAKCMGHTEVITDFGAYIRIKTRPTGSLTFCPSTDWSIAGPIIEREGITVQAARWVGPTHEVLEWMSRKLGRYDSDYFKGCWYGDTPLVAAMRCYVASKLGDEVDVPEELK